MAVWARRAKQWSMLGAVLVADFGDQYFFQVVVARVTNRAVRTSPQATMFEHQIDVLTVLLAIFATEAECRTTAELWPCWAVELYKVAAILTTASYNVIGKPLRAHWLVIVLPYDVSCVVLGDCHACTSSEILTRYQWTPVTVSTFMRIVRLSDRNFCTPVTCSALEKLKSSGVGW